MNPFLTSVENIAINLIFESIGEERCSRTFEEYARIAASLPPRKVLHGRVNDRLKKYEKEGNAPYQICHFRPGDEYIWYKEFPKSISMETVRIALIKFFPPEMWPTRRSSR